ncbi:O-antigen ligase family protein [Acinetobacter populi]|uniref:O-antigen ligase-related domain-containing protein n=1 Tax=Acinetobacter populi TaxID=1582270 RepID=A0A1Z9YWW0_9GAMM|nr:O-antigen ligase family protein [Acinetobacter populi]OUY06686.1 hypothetical protein CAP51_12205 [Acinetobacter populi]
MKKDTILTFLAHLIVWMNIVLPSGSLFGINVKFVILIIFIIYLILFNRSYILTKTFLSMIPIICFLMFEIVYAILFKEIDTNSMLGQTKDIFIFFTYFYLLIFYFRNNLISLSNSIVSAAAFVGILKFILLFYGFAFGVSISELMNNIAQYTNTAIMTLEVSGGFLFRINYISDSIISVAVFYLLTEIYNAKKIDKFMLIKFIALSFSALITMSRYQWAAYLMSIILTNLLYFKSKKAIATLIISSVFIFIVLLQESVQEMILLRFDSKTVDVSDIERVIQKNSIFSAIYDSPLLGNGIGYYIPNLIRSDVAKYLYELQIPALIMQFGVLGFIILLLITLFPLFNNLKRKNVLWLIVYCCVIGIWLGGAMINAILFSSSSALVFVLIYIYSQKSRLEN